MDQSPRTTDSMLLIQGIANLAPNGPDDGGLVVLAGSNKLHDAFFESRGGRDKCLENARENGYSYTPDDILWLTKQGCKVVKICAGAGDLLCESGWSESDSDHAQCGILARFIGMLLQSVLNRDLRPTWLGHLDR